MAVCSDETYETYELLMLKQAAQNKHFAWGGWRSLRLHK